MCVELSHEFLIATSNNIKSSSILCFLHSKIPQQIFTFRIIDSQMHSFRSRFSHPESSTNPIQNDNNCSNFETKFISHTVLSVWISRLICMFMCVFIIGSEFEFTENGNVSDFVVVVLYFSSFFVPLMKIISNNEMLND